MCTASHNPRTNSLLRVVVLDLNVRSAAVLTSTPAVQKIEISEAHVRCLVSTSAATVNGIPGICVWLHFLLDRPNMHESARADRHLIFRLIL